MPPGKEGENFVGHSLIGAEDEAARCRNRLTNGSSEQHSEWGSSPPSSADLPLGAGSTEEAAKSCGQRVALALIFSQHPAA